jgi:hypothetical protein
LFEALFWRRQMRDGPSLEDFWGAPLDAEEESMKPPARKAESHLRLRAEEAIPFVGIAEARDDRHYRS